MKNKLNLHTGWQPPKNWMKIKTIDAHTAGEPLRIILEGFPALEGTTILKKRKFVKENFDYLRTILMWEPRGHADMYGCLVTPPEKEDSDFGVLFLHNEGFSTMCGHGIIAVSKVLLETGMLELADENSEIRIDTPAGLVIAFPEIEEKKIRSIRFRNVPSFVLALDEIIEVPGLGAVKYDLAFGGAFYAFVNADELNIQLNVQSTSRLIEAGMKIKRAVMEDRKILHPFNEELAFLYGTIFTGSPFKKNNHSRNVCIFAEGEVDRSPTGTGVSARMAIHHKRGDLELNEFVKIESILGTTFETAAVEKTLFGSFPAIIPEVRGAAFITGKNEFYMDPADPLKNGFILR